jgi:integrase
MVWTPRRVKEWKRTGVRPAVAVWTPAQTAQFLDYISDHWLYAGVDLKVVADQLGHCSIVLTADTYVSLAL